MRPKSLERERLLHLVRYRALSQRPCCLHLSQPVRVESDVIPNEARNEIVAVVEPGAKV